MRLGRCHVRSPDAMADEGDHVISPEDDELYRRVLDEIYKRIEHARTRLPSAHMRPEIESCALQIRIAIELIVMGSLVTNRDAIESIDLALSSKKSASEAAKTARAANPDYWPKATTPYKAPGQPTIDLRPVEGALSEESWEREWGKLSAFLHARNPFKEHLSLSDARELVDRVTRELILLMNHHVVHLADRDGMLVGQIGPDGVSVTHFGLLAPASQAG
jgi:hypothetical protein